MEWVTASLWRPGKAEDPIQQKREEVKGQKEVLTPLLVRAEGERKDKTLN